MQQNSIARLLAIVAEVDAVILCDAVAAEVEWWEFTSVEGEDDDILASGALY